MNESYDNTRIDLSYSFLLSSIVEDDRPQRQNPLVLGWVHD